MKIVLLAAGRSSRIFEKIKKPKCLLQINNQTLIERIIENLNSLGKFEISIIVGFKSQLIKKKLSKYKNIRFIYNKHFKTRDMLYSFFLGLEKIKDNLIFSYTDIFYDKKIIQRIIYSKRNNNELIIPILKNWEKIWKQRKENYLDDAEDLKLSKKNFLKKIGGKINKKKITKYQYSGIFYIPKKKRGELIKFYKKFSNKKMHLTNFFNILIQNKIKIKCLKTSAKWYEFDDWKDYKNFKKTINESI